ncbi:hypothetical protein G6O69_16100 [Pseudenhygromyxa sp. WMMC2535]|uniref:hypothetical protein n=1 Tax=Pseudenhygromyxa sp. WMMC2535 TaxID=2712867 RepID=UPI0015572372|nr:hypothetical protein [Pseudenhygromyxa sp. WMMC2535]NVB39365.1 hypothetical protein [Pseudenhygromyxa sp. WMMC2535]
MNLEDYYNRLLSQGMTEPQIADLVAKEIMKQRSSQSASEEAESAPESLLGLVEVVLSQAETAETDTEESSSSSLSQQALAKRVADKIQGNSSPVGPQPQAIGAIPTAPELAFFAHTAHFAGPMPPPTLAREYEALVPGFTERCLVIHEKQVESQLRVVEESNRRRSKGQFFALIFCGSRASGRCGHRLARAPERRDDPCCGNDWFGGGCVPLSRENKTKGARCA